jgi:hypothetical protein
LNNDGLLEQASLVITPNSVKEGKLFSIKPTDGSGDLSVVRATSATIPKNAQGLVEVPRTNLVLQSQTFENAYWLKENGSINQNIELAPNDTLTANKFIETSSLAVHGFRNNTGISLNGIFTFSIYLKRGERRYVNLSYNTPASNYATGLIIDLDNGNITQTVGTGFVIPPTSVFIKNGWYKVSFTATYNGNSFIYINGALLPTPLSVGNGRVNYAGIPGEGYFIWGAQLEEGVTATEYIPTTSVIRTKFAGITQDGGSASNIARLDYTNGSCPSILVEPQRTNLALRSNELSTAPNVLDGVVATTNFYTSPDGSTNAIRLAETVANDRHGFFQYYTVTAQTYTVSIFTKQIGRRYISLMSDLNGTNTFSFFDLQNKVVVSSGAGYTCSIKEYADGWLRLSATVNASIGLRYTIWGGSTNGNTNTYVGNTSTFMTFYGLQLEAGSNATSYIPTVASAVTRNADVISKTGISSLINSVEGCFYVEAKAFVNGGSFRQFSLSNGTDNSRLTIGWSSVASRLLVRLDIGGTNIINTDILSFNQTSNNKVLFKWGGGNFKVFINGVEKLSLTSLTMPTANLFTKLGFDRGSSAGFFEGNVNEVIVFPTQLTDDECINLTTL